MKKHHATVGQDLSIRQHCCRIPINALSMFIFGTKDERKRGGGSVHCKVRHRVSTHPRNGGAAVSRTECWQKKYIWQRWGASIQKPLPSFFLSHVLLDNKDHADIHLSNTHNLLRDESIKNYTI